MTAGTPSHTHIALCIDDFGLHEGVNEAALRLAASGRVTAVSCMTGAPRWRAGAARLAAVARGTDVGLHLDLTEYPLTRGMRMSLPALVARSQARLLDRTRLRREIEAQLDAFETGFGQAPAHVDGHQHVHQFPVVRDLLVQALQARYPRQRPWLRSTRQPGGTTGKSWLIERLGAQGLCRLAEANGFTHNARLLGVYDFQGDAARYRKLLAQWLARAGEGDLLMCHPALTAPAHDAIAAARLREYEILAGDALPSLLEAAGVQLAPLSSVLSRG